MNEFKNITNGERSRTYVFPSGYHYTVVGVTAVSVSPSGTHRLESKDGKRIIHTGWIAIEIDCDEWSF